MPRVTKNMSRLEQLVRLALGGGGMPLAIVLLAMPASGAVAVLLWVVIGAAALDLLVSGALGYCPLYRYLDVPWARRTVS